MGTNFKVKHKFSPIRVVPSKVGDYKYVSWMYGVDRKICQEGHCLASRGLPSDAKE